ncbi:zonadhesin-like [Cydia fagiglandana]|uniref:zonadhesin-like n=1 Tax=Cydia fagiglandana TaxID=1458189 RepID=UPI002FEE2F92
MLGLKPLWIEVEKRATEQWYRMKACNEWRGSCVGKRHALIQREALSKLEMLMANNDVIKRQEIFDKKYRIHIGDKDNWKVEVGHPTTICFTDGSRRSSMKLAGAGIVILKLGEHQYHWVDMLACSKPRGNYIGTNNKARTDDGTKLRLRWRALKCSELGFPLNCDNKCEPGCKCKDGYVWNDKGVCIPVKTCPSCGGDKNAESGCGTNCNKTCASLGQKPPIGCPKICYPNSCDCRDGFYYDPKQKKCVKKEDCTPTCKKNEIYSSCIKGGCGPKNCSQINQPKICVDPLICKKGCICKERYLRAGNGTCIPKDQCLQKCPGQNEYYEKCINNCGSQNCSDRGKIYHCPNIVPGKCDSRGCRCKPGYLRDAKGVCVLEKDCPTPDCPYGEVWNPCPTVPCEGDNCAKTKDSPQSCPTGIVCSPARCVCGYNRKRAKNGTCVLITDCPPFKCGKNETYVACSSNCPGENCSDYINQTKCPKYRIGIVVNCKPACKCKKGYYRDKKGNCILACDCTKPPPKCGKNEVYDDCSSTSCKPTLCSQLGYPLKCDKECKPGCKCKDGYVHNDKGVCIPIKNCPSCGGDKNAVSGCGTNCGKTCASLGQKPPIVCPKICKLNSCDCRDGFYYDPNQKKCVKKEDCTPTCKVNEIYSTCINGGCGHKNCSQINKPIACVHPKICKKGCICKEGYLRADNGTCIPKDQCPSKHDAEEPPPKCGKNEVYDNCSSTSCKPTLCSQLGYPLKCDKKCKPGCKCKDGYVRNDKGVCIPIKNCPSCGGDKNAVSGCGTNCGKTCALLGQKPPFVCPKICKLNSCDCRDGFYYDPNQKKCVKKEDCTPTCKVNEIYSNCINGGCGPKNCSQINKPIACAHPKICKKGCICKKGYLRAINGTCIPKDQCPQPPPKCGKNEVYDNCSSTSCKPTLCSQLGYPLKCDKKCKPGCKCKDGYVRNDKGVCIPIKNCPSCGGDKNAVSGCGTNCGKTCASLGQKPPIVCPLICKLNSCDCRDGFYYDPNQKKCVKKEDCTRTCKENEIYSTCINGGCYPRSCSEINQSSACVEPEICKKGCICKKGYLRADNGTCIPKDQCPPSPDCPYGEKWDKCPTVPCEGDKCPKTKDSPQNCPTGIVCSPPRCVCGYNRKRAENGSCILITDCPPFKCGKNEMYVACSSNCPGEKCSDYINQTKCPPFKIGIIVNCKPACKCKKGYYRDVKGNCILACDCPVSTTTTPKPTRPPCGCEYE